MTKKSVLFGAAGAALITAGSSAWAADALPVVTTVVPTAPIVAVAPAPQFAVRIDAVLDTDVDFDPIDFDMWTDTEWVIDWQRPSSLGIQFLGDAEYYFGCPCGYVEFYLRGYRSFGSNMVGVYGKVDTDGDFVFGWDLEHRSGNIALYNDMWIDIWGGGWDLNNDTMIEFYLNDLVTIGGLVEIETNGFWMEIEGWVQLELGVIAPYAYAYISPTGGYGGFGFGFDFEDQIGTGPFSLIGNADVEFEIDGGFEVDVDMTFGIRYALGAANVPWWW